MRTMPQPFEPSEQPRLLTPAEVAILVKVHRDSRHWSQENLAAEAGVTERTIQRLERGEPTDLQTRRSIARALGFENLNWFNEPMMVPDMAKEEAKLKQEAEERERNFVSLEFRHADAHELLQMAKNVGAFSMGYASDVEVPEDARRPLAELQDYMTDCIDISDDLSATQMLELADGLTAIVRELEAAGLTIASAQRLAEMDISGGKRMPIRVGYILVCKAGTQETTAWVSKKVA